MCALLTGISRRECRLPFQISPPPLDPSVGLTDSDEKKYELEMRVGGEQIFVISYHVVQLTRSLDKNAKHYVKADVGFAGPARGKKHHHMLGRDEEEDMELESE